MRRLMLTAVVTALAGLGAAAAWAQHGRAAADAAHPHQTAETCAAEFEKVVGEGRGFGMGFAADQKGYPGPMHALDLKERLGLTAEQTAKAQALVHAMFAESRPKSAPLLEAEAKLAKLFAAGTAGEAAVRAAVAEVERARTEVRLVHLLTHLKTRDLLTDAQRRAYHEARWGAR